VKKSQRIQQVRDMSLPQYLRWLASTFEYEPLTRDELLRRAHQADGMIYSVETSIDALRVLNKYAKSTRPGGRLLASDPDFDAIDRFIAKAEGK